MQTVPPSDSLLADLIVWVNKYRVQYNVDQNIPQDQALPFVFEFDGLPRNLLASSAEPTAPHLKDLWVRGNFLYECTSLTPMRPLNATWDLVQDSTDLWTSNITQLIPTYQPVGMDGLPAGTVPGAEGTMMQNRLYLVGPAASALEAVPLVQLDALSAEVIDLDRKIRELRQQQQLPTSVQKLEVSNDPSGPLDAVNMRWAQSEISQIHSWVDDIRHAVNTRPGVDFDSLEQQVTAIRTAMLKVQDVTNLMRTTGGRFDGKVFVPFNPNVPPTHDTEAVAWGYVKNLRGAVGELKCVDGSMVHVDPDLDGDGDLAVTVELFPQAGLVLNTSLYETDSQYRPMGNPLTTINLTSLLGKVFQLQVEVSSTIAAPQPIKPFLTDPNWELVVMWNQVFPVVPALGTLTLTCQIRWLGPLPAGNTRTTLPFRRQVPATPIQLPSFI